MNERRKKKLRTEQILYVEWTKVTDRIERRSYCRIERRQREKGRKARIERAKRTGRTERKEGKEMAAGTE
jgi:tRNA A37 threonylcarbamoyladenosine biosynthesis protein TsaE